MMKAIFARHNIPETVVSDNATQLSSSEFQDFALSGNFFHVTSSPQFPQSNGKAESAVKIAKSLLSQDDPVLALLIYRSTPLPSLSLSPAELAFGRRFHTTLPTLSKTLKPRLIDPSDVFERDTAAKEKQKYYHDQRHGVHSLSPLQPGDPVLIKTDEEKKCKDPAEVVSQVAPRSFVLRRPNGTCLRRNRKHIRLCPSPAAEPPATLYPAVAMTSSSADNIPLQSQSEEKSPPDPPPQPAPDVPLQPAPTSTSTVYYTRSGRAVKRPSWFQ